MAVAVSYPRPPELEPRHVTPPERVQPGLCAAYGTLARMGAPATITDETPGAPTHPNAITLPHLAPQPARVYRRHVWIAAGALPYGWTVAMLMLAWQVRF